MGRFSLVIYCSAILFASLAGGLVPLLSALTHTRLQIYLSFAAGVMLGTAFFHVVPESVHLAGNTEADLNSVMLWLTSGLLGMFFVERFFAFHHHEVQHEPANVGHVHEHGKHERLAWGPAAIGLCLHTLVGGVALASATAAGQKGGWLAFWVFLAIVLHKPADSLTIVTLMVRGGATKASAHLVNAGFALMVPLGAASFFAGRAALALDWESFTGRALAFSAGTFLCISLSDLLPELQFHEHDRLKLSAALLAGAGLMFLAARLHAGA